MSELSRSHFGVDDGAPSPIGSVQRGRVRFPIVGVGAMAGSEETLGHFFEQIDADSSMAYVVVHPLTAEYSAKLARALQSHTSLPVVLVQDEARLQPNHIYIHPPDRFLSVEDGVLCVETFPTHQKYSIVDHFLMSLAKDQAEFAVGMLLTGFGSDGLRGLAAIKERGGLVMVETTGDAVPEQVAEIFEVSVLDVSGPVETLAQRLKSYAVLRTEIRLLNSDSAQSDENADILGKIFFEVREQTGHDFALYKRSMLLRRLERRMQLREIATLHDYWRYLRQTPSEAEILFRDCLITVTQFFRDADAFAMLRQRIVPSIFVGKSQEDTVRVWVPGCATGEEAYSIAILLHAYAAQLTAPPQIQIFATDVNENALSIARKGWYSAAAADIPTAYLSRFFTEENGGYCIAESVRETVLFARHNLLSDPPFAHLDLVSCRNLLIYLQRQAQRQILELFHYALHPGGYLFLGNAASIETAASLFADEDKRYSLFRSRKMDRSISAIPSQLLKAVGEAPHRSPDAPVPATDIQDIYRIWHQKHYGHPSLLVDDSYHLFAIFSGAGRYLQDADGVVGADVVQRIPVPLRLDLRMALHAAFRNRQHTRSRPILVRIGNEEVVVQMHVGPVEEERFPQKYVEVVFIEQPVAPVSLFDTAPPQNEDSFRLRQVEEELQQTRLRLQSTVEEYESITEELTASNEELQAMNEELRSTSEELESSKEEVQAINEELVAVNGELKLKVNALHLANTDLQNLIESTDMAILFLDRDLRLQRYTPRATEIFHLIPADIGRPFEHITHRVLYEHLLQDATRVVERMTAIEQEVQSADGRWFIAHFSPYRTLENQINGVVLTFVDVTALKLAEQGLIRRARQQAAVADLGQFALEDADLDELRQQVTSRVAETLDIELTKIQELTADGQQLLLTAGVGWREGLVGQNRVRADKSTQAGYTLYTGRPIIVDDMSQEERFSGPPLLTDHNVVSGLTVVIRGSQQTYGVLGVHSTQARRFIEDDIHFLQAVATVVAQAIDRYHAQQALAQINAELENRVAQRTAQLVSANAQLQAEVKERRRAQERFYKAFHVSPAASVIASLTDLRYLNVNASFLALTGYSEDEVIGRRAEEVDLTVDLERREPATTALRTGHGVEPSEARIRTKSGQIRYVIAAGEPIEIDGQLCLLGMMVDITERKQAEEALRQSQELLIEAEHLAEMGSWEWNIAEESMHWSQGMYRIFGLGPDAQLTADSTFLEHIHPQDRVRVQSAFRKARIDPHPFEIEHRILPEDGSVRTVILRAKIVVDAAGQPIKMVGTSQDITRRKATEEALRQSEERLNMALAASGVGIYEYAVPLTGESYYSERFASILGYRLDELPPPRERMGWLAAQLHQDDQPMLVQIYEDMLHDRIDHYDVEVRLRHKHGEWIYVRALASVYDATSDTKRIVGVLQDITHQKDREAALHDHRESLQAMVAVRTQELEQRTAQLAEEVLIRKQAEEQLRDLNESLEIQVRSRTGQVRELASALTLAEQRERQRIAGILHDHLQQLLYALLFRMQLMQESTAEEVAAMLPQFRGFVEEAVATTRTLTVDLSPPILAGEGLVEALLWLSEQMREIHHLTVEVDVRERPPEIQEELRVLLFQLVRELLFNVVKHAGVANARLTIGVEDQVLLLIIADDGVGFEAGQALSGQKSATGWGLFSIRERLGLFGASFEIQSTLQQGTRATIRFPLSLEKSLA